MNALQKTLAIIAFLVLSTQTIRHAYLLWLEPRQSVLDKYDRPLKGEITKATSLDELLRRYDPVRKEADKAREEWAKADKQISYAEETTAEPYKSERELRAAITEWERRSNEIRELRFYWLVGLAFCLSGLLTYRKQNRWFGLTLIIAAFGEIIYWTSPTFLGSTREFDRLLVNKFAFSVVSLALAGFVIWFLGIFTDKKEQQA